MRKHFGKLFKILTVLMLSTLMIVPSFGEMAPAPAGGPGPGGGPEQDKKAVILLVGAPKAQVFGTLAPIDGDNEKVVPLIEAGRTLVPLRFISKAFGATVNWNPADRVITITAGQNSAVLTLGSSTMMVNK